MQCCVSTYQSNSRSSVGPTRVGVKVQVTQFNWLPSLFSLNLFPLPCGAGNAVPREGFDLSVIILASLLVFPMLGCRHSLLRLLAIFHVFVKWNEHFQTFLLVNTCQSGVIT